MDIYDRTLDFHKYSLLTSEQVKCMTEDFIMESYNERANSILIITGRSEKAKIPMVRPTVQQILSRCKYVKDFRLNHNLGSFAVYLVN